MNQQNKHTDQNSVSNRAATTYRSHQQNRLGTNRLVFAIAIICSFLIEINAQENLSSPGNKQTTRVLYVPFENLNILFDGSSQHVYLSKKEYEGLLEKAKIEPVEKTPRDFVYSSVEHKSEILGSYAVINTKLTVETFRDGLHAIPIDFKNVSLQSAAIGGNSAPLGKNANNQTIIFLDGRSIHEVDLQFVSLVKVETARQSVGFQLPTAATSKFSIAVAGNVELTSGPAVVGRVYDAAVNRTSFQLVPSREFMSMTMSVNNKKLQAKKSILAKSVVIHELTSNYEQIHARVNVDILYGSTNEIRFGLPKDFQITEVSCADMSQWRIENPEAESVLVVQLRTDVTKSFALNIAATSTKITPEKWTLNRLKPIDFDGELSVIGIVAEERFELQSLSSKGLVSLDNQKIQASIPETVFKTAAGAPAIETVAAYFSPDGNFELNAEFTRPKAKLVVKPTSILFLSDRNQKMIGQFQLTAENEKVIDFDLLLPAGWRLMSITGGNGAPLSFQRFVDAPQTRINAKLPGGLAPGASNTIVFEAQMTSDQWSSSWSETEIQFPKFEVNGSELTTGAIAVAVEDDLAVRPKETTKLETLLKEQKSLFGLDGFNTAIAFEIVETDYNATLVVQRLDPQITATTYSFFRQKTKQLDVRYEIAFDIQTARAQELKFSLAKTTPSELQIRGLNGILLSQTDSTEIDDVRVWTLKLSEPRLGEVRIAVDFVQPLKSDEVQDYQLPMILIDGVEYQTSLFAFEGNPDFDIELTTAMRPIDVGEMGDAEYVPGSRLLGSYSSVGIDPDLSIDVKRRNIHQLPSAIVEKSTLVSVVSRNGRSQTEAKYTILTKVPFLELKLPKSAELWSVMLDGVPTRPQVRGGSVVISMPPDTTRRTREVSVFYEDEIVEFGLSGKINMQAPALLVRNDARSKSSDVPQADIDWSVTLPSGYSVASNDGSVFTTEEERKPLPFEKVLSVLTRFVISTSSYSNEMLKSSKAKSDVANDASVNGMVAGTSQAEFGDEIAAGEEASASPDDAKGGMDLDDLSVNEDAKIVSKSASPQQSQPQFQVPRDQPFRGGEMIDRDRVRPPAAPMPAKKLATKFSLKGKRGLNIQTVALSFEEETQTFNFKSLGAQPEVAITIVDQDRFHWLSFAYGGLVIAIGLMLCIRSVRMKIGFTMVVVGIAAVVPMLGDWTQVVWRGLENSLYAVCFLIGVWIVYAILAVIIRFFGRDVTRWFRNIVRTRRPALLLAFVGSTSFMLTVCSELTGQEGKKSPPIQIPNDAIIIPYDPENPDVESEQIFIPYQKYIELKRKADPDKTELKKPLVAEFGWCGAEYKTTLTGRDLLINGRLQFESFTDNQIAIPLDLESAVITKALLDGEPAQLKVATSVQIAQQKKSLNQSQQAKPQNKKGVQPATQTKQLLLYVQGRGVKTLEVEFRLPIQQVGGWRMIRGRLPAGPASKIELSIPKLGTELNYSTNDVATEFVSTAAVPNLTIPLGSRGEVALSWRGQVSSAQVDQNLSVNSTALFDVRNDGLHLVWKLDFLFRASTRSKFDVELPKDFSVVRVYGGNIRGWEVRNQDTMNILDVTLLSEADSKESFTIELSNRKMDLKSATAFPMPTVVVPDAAIHSGQITVRKTSSLELQTDTMIGISRIDFSSASQVKPRSEPLFQPIVFQAFEFSRTPFSVAIQCRPKLGGLEVKTRTLIDIREKTCGMETQFVCSSLQPIHELTVVLPVDLDIQNIRMPVGFRKTVKVDESTQLLKLFLSQGLNGTFAFDISGRLADHQAIQNAANQNPSSVIPLPKIFVQNAGKQSGQFAAIAESRLIVQPAELNRCESVLVSQVKPWLSSVNQTKAQVAINHKSEDYAGKLMVTKKPALVDATSITNVNVTLRSIEESIIVNYEIRDNGIDEVSFLIPAEIKDATIKADLIREKVIEPVGDGDNPSQYRVTLKLQDFVIGQFRVLVEKDFGLSSSKRSASIPAVENIDSSKRFVTLQNSGFDELLVPDTREMENLDRRQKPFRDLKELVGGADIRRGFLVNATAQDPLLTYQTNPRKLVETVGASIGLSEIKMSIDRAGAYRVEQKFFVDNRTEPFLEIKLPSNAKLWTVKVADSLVKPIAVEAEESSVRIPLIKTAEGDSDFVVEIKYGGSIERLSNFAKIEFPFAETVGIKVSESNVRLYVPEDFDFDFKETSSLAISEEKLIADAKSRYEVSLFSKLNSQARNSKNELVKQRAIRNLIELQANQEKVSRATAIANLYSEDDVQREIEVDNRGRFNDLLQTQKVELFGNSGNLSNTYGGNWDKAQDQQVRQQPNVSVHPTTQSMTPINEEWFGSNGLVNPELISQNRSNKRFNSIDFIAPAEKPRSGKADSSKEIMNQETRWKGRKSGQMGGGGFGGVLSTREKGLQQSGEGLESKNEIAQENFKKQIADNINSIQRQSQSQQGQQGGNSKDRILRRYSQQNGPEGQNTSGIEKESQRQKSPMIRGSGVNIEDEATNQNRRNQPNDPAGLVGGQANTPMGNSVALSQADFVSASLEIEFDHRGKEVLFRTTSNELNLEATVISKSIKRRSTNFFVLFGLMIILGFGFWFFKPRS